jgi:hypothetical protein
MDIIGRQPLSIQQVYNQSSNLFHNLSTSWLSIINGMDEKLKTYIETVSQKNNHSVHCNYKYKNVIILEN